MLEMKPKRKKRKLIIILFMVFLLLFMGCMLLDNEELEDYSNSDNQPYLGSAKTLSGNTVVISIFTDDSVSSWEDAEDGLRDNSLDYLTVACNWLEENASRYGSKTEFIYDWEEHPELKYEAYIDTDICDEDDTYSINTLSDQFISDNIDVDGIAKKYDAENIIYIMYVNTPWSNNQTSYTFCNYNEDYDMNETCYIFMHVQDEVECPAAIAHEMLHTFGAPDLYLVDNGSNNNYGITEEYVEKLKRDKSEDIMYTTFNEETLESYYDRIENDFSNIDAYYVGIINNCDEVSEWGFLPSQHVKE